MVDLEGTNPVSGESVDTTDPDTWTNYAIGGAVLMGAIAFGRWMTDTVSDATGVGDTVSENIMELS